ncbi:MAG: discoidin domain-containing protein [Tannerella sp.]|jgi:hypothetical protein|nr:discoidin domain-containing protein [Tannerella sp.]
MKKVYGAGCCLLLIAVCSCRESRLEQALAFAGDNRAELEKVLTYYSADQADSLKYRAACFLIENMPFHYSYSSRALDRFIEETSRYAAAHEYGVHEHNRYFSSNSFEEDFPSPASFDHAVVMDSHAVTAGYLIENIEQAFRVWREQPWGKDIPFDDFCEQILPYRVADEPLQDWRQLYYDYFKPRVDSLCGRTSDLPAVGRAVYDIIYGDRRWIFETLVTSRHAGAATIFHNRLGDCRLMACYAVYAFRALGIPCGIDMIVQNPDMLHRQHYWNYMKDNGGKTVRFEVHQMAPSPGSNRMNRKTGKIYRSFFGEQPGSLPCIYGTALPAPLNDRLTADVTHEYYEGATLEIEPSGRQTADGDLLYLCVFNNAEWIPVTCSRIKNGKALFEHVEPGIVYQPVSIADGRRREGGFPVAVLPDGSLRFMKPDTGQLHTLTLKRKYPWPDWYRPEAHRSAGGRFEVAGDRLFTHPVTIHTHTDSLTFDWYGVTVDCPEKVRYVRYCSARDGHINIAEIRFISNGKMLAGKPIGFDIPHSFHMKRTKEAAFDGDPLTYCDSSLPDGEWVGLELDEAARITGIEYIFRNDDNSIREGDVYELFCFTDTGRVSYGKRTGLKNGTLTYRNVPSGALYLLHNETRGREERPFTLDNDGRQVWW